VRTSGALLVTGGLLGTVLRAVNPGSLPGHVGVTVGIAVIAIAVGAYCLLLPGLVPDWFLPLSGPAAIVLVAVWSSQTRTATDGSELLYMWTVMFSAYFLPWRFAVANVAVLAAVYPPIAISILGRPGITPSVYLIGTSVVTLVIVANMRRRVTRRITVTALEARTDTLTGLPNRRSWEEGLIREVARQARRGTPLCVLMVDLDHFKRLNDTHGHAAGDIALAGVAAILRGQARQSDVLARVGGEEFALLLPDCAPVDAAARAEEIRLVVEQTAATWRTPVTVSIGVAALPAQAGTGEELMMAGDVALYEAKRAGRNTVRMYPVTASPAVAGAPAPAPAVAGTQVPAEADPVG
jgi:diguanylate cyclase (GGDEF)-like protein